MSDDRNNKAVSREFLAERDLRIFKMRQAGVSTTEIARRFGITSSVVNRAVQRQLSRLNSEALLAYPEVLRMELERLDNLQQAIWPMTQHRKVTMDDGTEVAVEPDLKAIQQVLSIMDRRSKLLGMEQNTVNVNMDIRDMNPIKATLAGEASTARALSDFDAEGEARQLLEIMGSSGVLPSDTVRAILGQGEIVDAEVVETEQDE
jgi:transposase-like protein